MPLARPIAASLLVLFSLAAQSPEAVEPPPVLAREAIRDLPDEQLMRAFADPSAFTPGPQYAEGADDPGWQRNPQLDMFGDVVREVVRRGDRLVPALAELIRRDRSVDRPSPASPLSGAGTFRSDVVAGLATEYRNQPFAAVLVETLVAPDSTHDWRRAAQISLERSTHLSYFRSEPHHGTYADAVQRDGAEPPPFKATQEDFAAIAAFYEAWLAGEGRDPGQWLPLARRRARAILASDDLALVYCAATFLQGGGAQPRDDDPTATMNRVAAILKQAKFERLEPTEYGGFPVFSFAGQPFPPTTANWTRLLANYGPAARPHAPTLVRIARHSRPNMGAMDDLIRVGGEEATAYLTSVVPAIEAELQRQGLDRPAFRDPLAEEDQLPKARSAREWLRADRVARFGVDRWLGRTFDTNAERLAAWEASRARRPEQTLRANVADAARAADGGDVVAAAIVHAALPDAPRPKNVWGPTHVYGGKWSPPPTAALPDGATRAAWLKEHGDRLVYDPLAHALRLPKP